jgi:Dolichyl-phosphate-mannose-protein mannosyltransferase
LRPRGLAPFLAAALAALSLWLVYDHTRGDSLSTDEPIHILSGWFGVAAGSAIVNIEHPPFLKALSGLALLALPLAPPPKEVPMRAEFPVFGRAFFFHNRVPVDRVVAIARSPFLVLLGLLLVLTFVAARRRYGDTAAVFAVGILALDPNFVAHAGVVHTDLGAALAFLATVLAWERVRQRPTLGRLVAASLCLGLALASKFSAVYILPILLIQTLMAARGQADPGAVLGKDLLRMAAICLGALAVVFLAYAVVTRHIRIADEKQIIQELVGTEFGAPRLASRIASIADFSPAIAQYLGGLAAVVRQNAVGGGVNYLFGRLSVRGFPEYFFVAFAVKSTLAFLAVTALAIAAAVGRKSDFREEIRLFLVPVVVLFLASVGTTYNIGIRHMLPVYPFLALAGAAVLARSAAEKGSARAKAAVAGMVILPLLSGFEIARIHPHELSFFNALVGPERGRHILSDSNVDWGLDLKRLALLLKERRVTDPTVAYFGADTVEYRIGMPDFTVDPRVRGRLVAISAFYMAAGPEFLAFHGAWDSARALERLRKELNDRGRVIGRVGYSIDLYDLPPKGNSSP